MTIFDLLETMQKHYLHDDKKTTTQSLFVKTQCCVFTCIIRHGGLIRVTLLLEGHVTQLKHRRHDLQQTCRGRRTQLQTLKHAVGNTVTLASVSIYSPICSSSAMLMILMASMVSRYMSRSCCPGIVTFPLDRNRYLL